LNSAFAVGDETSYADVAQFIVDNRAIAPHTLLDLAQRVLTPNLIIFPLSTEIDAERATRDQIHLLRLRLAEEPRNAIAWTDLARLYTSVGLNEKAVSAMRSALFIAPTNRFVLRSAGRLFLHTRDTQFVLRLLHRNSDIALEDPWLTAAEISLASATDVPSRFAKKGFSIAEDEDLTDFSRTELQSALATLEMTHGKNRNARRLFQQSLTSPNENSLAQVEWVARHVGGIAVPRQKLEISHSFEARAYDSFFRQTWREAIDNGTQWVRDETYSSRPLMFVTYVDSSILEGYSLSIELLKQGLLANPRNPGILNNLAFALASCQRLDEAEDALKEALTNADPEHLTDNYRIALLATNGLLLMRRGHIEKGREYYRSAFREAVKIGNKKYRQLATIYLAKEEILANTVEAGAAFNAAKKEMGDTPDFDIEQIFARVSELFESKQAKKRV